VSERLRVLVAGMVAGDPNQGGAAWAVLQYVLGLRRLGHHVYLVEPVEKPSDETRDYFDAVVKPFGVDGELLTEPRQLEGFDVVLNISGMLVPDVIKSVPLRVYLDLDPAFNQFWQEDGINRGLEGHTHFATVGLAIGLDGCKVPTLGRTWIPTLPPVVLDEWPRANGIAMDALTTVGNFRGYGSIERAGVHYGQKVHSLRRLIGLPGRTHERFVLAMTVHPDEQRDLAALEANGWELIDPTAAAGTPAAYRDFIRGSRAEIGIAKAGYVASRCGWFSDRSACYLASGRPVVAQDTGFSSFLPVGEGLLAFDDEDGAVSAIEELRGEYPRHARAAWELAKEYFDSDRVLTKLLEQLAS
jgi:hypothetical protein